MLLICEEFSKILIADAGCSKKLFFETIMMRSRVTYHEALWKLFDCFTLVLLVLDFSEISESEIFFSGKKEIKVKDLVVHNKKFPLGTHRWSSFCLCQINKNSPFLHLLRSELLGCHQAFWKSNIFPISDKCIWKASLWFGNFSKSR